MMTRKDFIILQDNMRHVRPRESDTLGLTPQFVQWQEDIKQLAHALKLISPHFDATRFIEACKGINYDNEIQDSISGGRS